MSHREPGPFVLCWVFIPESSSFSRGVLDQILSVYRRSSALPAHVFNQKGEASFGVSRKKELEEFGLLIYMLLCWTFGGSVAGDGSS